MNDPEITPRKQKIGLVILLAIIMTAAWIRCATPGFVEEPDAAFPEVRREMARPIEEVRYMDSIKCVSTDLDLAGWICGTVQP